MGMMLDPTPGMGEFHAEVRRESFYLQAITIGSAKPRVFLYPNVDNDGSGVVEFELSDIPKIRAALDQVEAYVKDRK